MIDLLAAIALLCQVNPSSTGGWISYVEAAQARCHSFYSKCLLRDDKVTKERVIACTQAFAELPRR